MQTTLNRQAEQLKSLHATVGKIDSCVIKLEAVRNITPNWSNMMTSSLSLKIEHVEIIYY